jgi:hypothetical protein
MLRKGQRAASLAVTRDKLAPLPPPVQRYLEYCNVVGKRTVRTVHLTQRGFFRRGDKWLPLTAEQYFTVNPPAFLWHGSVRMAPLLRVTGGDSYLDGKGHLSMRLLSLFKVADLRGPELDQSELLRYMLETSWFPTGWLSNYLSWEELDNRSAKVTINDRGVQASGTLHFTDEGQLTKFTAERYYDEGHDKFTLKQWAPRVSVYKEINDVRIPTDFEVVWNLESGEYSYMKAQITGIEYDKPLT